jgi:hypothetical protein
VAALLQAHAGCLRTAAWILMLGFFSLPVTFAGQQPVISKPSPAVSGVEFVDVATRAGLTARTEAGGEKAKKYIIETTGSGAASVDLDGDGWPDIFLANGTTLEGFPKGPEPTSHFYRNNRNGTFTDVTQKSGAGLSGWGQGVCAGDYDNDGRTDLYVTFWGHSVLLHNNGDGTFSDVTKKAGLWHDAPRWETGCAFVEYDRSGRVGLFVSQYVDLDLAKTPVPGSGNNCLWKGIPVMCGPRGLQGTHSELFRNNGDGTFTDVSEQSGVSKTDRYYCFTALTGDFDNDGWPDIFVACDSTPSLLFHNNRNGTFTEVGVASGVAFNGDGREQAGMGAHAADYDGDGWPDIIRTNFSDDTATLFHNNRDGTFSDVTNEAGLGRNMQFLGWGTLFVDVDNDGWPDIFLANGHVYPEVEGKGFTTTFRERKVLYRNLGNGKFKDISLEAGEGISTPFNSHGVAAADFENDGASEILVNNSHDPPSLLKNLGQKGNWLLVKLVGTRSNRDAIGARVTLTVEGRHQTQEVRSGGGYNSQSDFRLHFGLRSALTAESVEIQWPSGTVQKVEKVGANQILVITEEPASVPDHRKR